MHYEGRAEQAERRAVELRGRPRLLPLEIHTSTTHALRPFTCGLDFNVVQHLVLGDATLDFSLRRRGSQRVGVLPRFKI